MTRQPGVIPQRQPSGEQDPAGVGQAHCRTQQRMLDRPQSECGRVAVRRRRFQPVPLTLEGVGGQVDPLGVETGEHGVPVDRGVVQVGLTERGQQRDVFGAVPAERG